MGNRKVYITGLGIVSSNGHTYEAFQDALKAGVSGIDKLSEINGIKMMTKVGAPISSFSLKERIAQNSYPEDVSQQVKRIVRKSSLMLETVISSALEAYDNAKLWNKRLPSERIGVIVAGSNLIQKANYEMAIKYQDSCEYISPNYALQFFDTNLVGILSEIFEMHGEGQTIGGASASGNVALVQAYRLIKLNVLDACLVVGPMADFSPLELQAFCNLGAMGGTNSNLNAKEVCRPFDKLHEGFILGQGSGCVILEAAESAEERKVNIFGEMLGGSIALDGNRFSDARQEGEVRAMKNAINESNIKIEDIDYINAHGTSTPLGDEVELKSIKQVFKKETERIWVNSTKGMTGHCLFSAGIIEAIASIIQLRSGFIHPNLNLIDPINTDCRLVGTKAVSENIKTAMSNSFGFGGINTSIILRTI